MKLVKIAAVIGSAFGKQVAITPYDNSYQLAVLNDDGTLNLLDIPLPMTSCPSLKEYIINEVKKTYPEYFL